MEANSCVDISKLDALQGFFKIVSILCIHYGVLYIYIYIYATQVFAHLILFDLVFTKLFGSFIFV